MRKYRNKEEQKKGWGSEGMMDNFLENGSVVHFDLVYVGAIIRSPILENVGFGESVVKIQDFLDQSG